MHIILAIGRFSSSLCTFLFILVFHQEIQVFEKFQQIGYIVAIQYFASSIPDGTWV